MIRFWSFRSRKTAHGDHAPEESPSEPDRRGFVAYAAANMYAKPVLERFRTQVAPDPVWQAVHDLMRVRMRAVGPMPRGKLPAVLA
jgi:hypothetical protein